ncbi:MAG TPA: 3-hydroxyacyl-CoA dehydrogenase NAD-binding domain-containing protein [Myxococcales bacterium LLY-WYZ-16_1]|nr:3-hydroxyacyl-CoA dehydrogenase NAD-binding domain-containing protein [Myxococcales bacterium LLY-WYZ-16_1]
MNDFGAVLVVGAGTMGAGIAEVAAKAGASVTLADIRKDQLISATAAIERSLGKAVDKGKISQEDASAALGRVDFRTEADGTEKDLIIEAVSENMGLKKDLFQRLGSEAPEAVLASNTSSLSITELAASAMNPRRVIGLHFFNPPPIMPLIEIVRAEQTAPEVIQRAESWAVSLGKSPIIVRDMPGFATSRLGVALGLEAIRMLETAVADVAAIDRAMELGYRHPMGPLKLTDLVGLDVRLAIADHLTREIGPQFAPPPLLRQLVRAGKLGKKTGEGFYIWTTEGPIPSRR